MHSQSFSFPLPLLSTSLSLSCSHGHRSLRSHSWGDGKTGRCSWGSWWPGQRSPECRPLAAPCPYSAPASESSRPACWCGTPRTCPGWPCCWRGTRFPWTCWTCAGSVWGGGTRSWFPPTAPPRRSRCSDRTAQRGRNRWLPKEEES